MTLRNKLFRAFWMQNQNAPEPSEAEVPLPYCRIGALTVQNSFTVIDTGLLTDPTDEWIIGMGKLKVDGNSNGHICGGSWTKTDSNTGIYAGGGNNGQRLSFAFGNTVSGTPELEVLDCDLNVPHELRMKQSTGEVWVDGVLKGQVPVTDTLAHPNNLVLFGQTRGSKIQSRFVDGFISSFKIIRGGTLVRDFVPAIQVDGSATYAGMVDMEAVRRGTGQTWYPYASGRRYNYDVKFTVDMPAELLTYKLNLANPYTTTVRMGSTVDWGDGTSDSVDGVEYPEHTYAEPGEYQIHANIKYHDGAIKLTVIGDDDNAKLIKSVDEFAGHYVPKGFIRYARNATAGLGVFSNVRCIDDYAFADSKIAWPALPRDVLQINRAAFQKCTSITVSSLPANLVGIGIDAFKECANLALRTIPSTVTDIGSGAFSYCTNMPLKSLDAPVTIIGASTFKNCTNLALCTLPTTITEIGTDAFRSCPLLALTELPSSLQVIRDGAFWSSSNIAISRVPEGVTTIDKNAFNMCRGITSMTLPSTLETIGMGAFGNCTALTTVVFLGTPTTLAASCFNNCRALTDIYVPWSEGAIAKAPWGATNATVHYDYHP